MSDSVYVICDNCGHEFEENELTETSKGFFCADCLSDIFEECSDCGQLIERSELLETGSGSFICHSCYDDSYFTCEDCDEIFPDSDAVYIESTRRVVCEDCINRHYTLCHECNEYIHDEEIISTEYDGNICRDCYYESYFTCSDCGYVYHNNAYAGDGLCEGCADSSGIHEYSYRPTSIFHRSDNEPTTGRLYFGIELELSHSDRDARKGNMADCLATLDDNGQENNVYLKEDGSLETGFEIVSHPRTLDSWHEFRPKIESYFQKARNYTDGKRDGLHVHISRRGMTPAHMARFGAFVAACQDEITLIARRNAEDWAKYHKKPKTGKEVRTTVSTASRYTALNWCPSSTVELRVFRATLDPVEFFAAIEFAHAAYRFTKHAIGIMEIIKGKPWEQFLTFLNANKGRYGSLIAFLRNRYAMSKEHYGSYINALTVKQRSHKK